MKQQEFFELIDQYGISLSRTCEEEPRRNILM